MYFIVFNPILIVSQDGICIRIVNVACKNKTPVFSLVDVTCVDISLTDDVTTFHGNADISSLVDVTNIDDIIVCCNLMFNIQSIMVLTKWTSIV